MNAYEEAHLELTDRLSELMDALAKHRRAAAAASPEERHMYVADLAKWTETIDGILLGYVVG